MLDPRIYRTGLVVVVLAVIAFAFSLEGQQGGLGMNTTLPPDAFNGVNAYHDMLSLAREQGPAGSAGDYAIAAQVKRRLRSYNFTVQSQFFRAATPTGKHPLESQCLSTGTQRRLSRRGNHRPTSGHDGDLLTRLLRR